MTGGAGFPLPPELGRGLPRRCLLCGNSYEVPAEGPVRCPFCPGKGTVRVVEDWPECVGCGELSPAGECPSCRNDRYREKAW